MLVTKLCLRLVAQRLDRRLTQSWMGVLLVLVFLLPILDVTRLRAALSAHTPAESALLGALLPLVLALTSRRGLRSVFFGRHVSFLVRQPIAPWRWSVGLALPLLLAGLPLLLLAALHPGAHPLARVSLWLSCWAPVAIALSGHRWRLVALTASASGGFFALSAAAPSLLPLWSGLGLGWALLLTGRSYLRGATAGPGRQLVWSWRPRTALGALVQRDVLCLLRLEPRSLLTAPLAGIAAGAMQGQLEQKQTFSAEGLTDSAAALLALGAIPALIGVVGRLLEQLRGRLMPPGWPVSAAMRATSLGLVAMGASTPALAAVGAASPLPRLPLLVLEALTLAAGAALLCSTERLGRFFAFCAAAALSAAIAWPLLAVLLAWAAHTLHKDLSR